MESNYTKKFIRFLKENGVFTAFIREFYNVGQIKIREKWVDDYLRLFSEKPTVSLTDYCEKIKDKEEFFQYAFLWDKSRQGDGFWRNLSMEWRKYCDYLK